MGTWCHELADLMLPFDRIALSRADLVFMGAGTPGFSYLVADPCPDSFSQVLKSDIAIAMPRYPMGAHLRLDFCSFRSGTATPRVVGANGALWLMRQANPRVSGVIRRGLSDAKALSLFLFPWLPIPPWAEFRIFIRQGQRVGVSQYHPNAVFAQIAQHEQALIAAFDSFVDAALPRLPQPDLALDVLAEPLANGGFRMRLVDLSVLGPRTDTLLFTWENGGDFDGSFRFLQGDTTVTPHALPQTHLPPEPPSPPVIAAPTAATLPAKSPSPDDDVWRI